MARVEKKRKAWLARLVSLATWLCCSLVACAAEPAPVLQGHKGPFNSLAFSPDGKTLAAGSADKTINLWKVIAGTERGALQGHTDAVAAVAFSPDGKHLVSGSADKSIKVWDIASGKELATLEGHTIDVTNVAFSPNGKLLASVAANFWFSYRSEIKLWDWDAGAAKLQLALPDGNEVSSLAFGPDSKTLAFGNAGEITLWDVAVSKELASPKIHHYGAVNSLAYSPDGKTLAYGGGYKNRPTVTILWDLATDKQRADIGRPGHGLGCVAYSPDGRTVAAWTRSYNKSEQIRLWDPNTGKQRAAIQTNGVRTVAFSPDSKKLAVAEWESGIRVFDVAVESKP